MILFIQVILKLYAMFQPSTMSGSAQKVFGGGGGEVGWWWVLRPIILLSLAKAEQQSNIVTL